MSPSGLITITVSVTVDLLVDVLVFLFIFTLLLIDFNKFFCDAISLTSFFVIFAPVPYRKIGLFFSRKSTITTKRLKIYNIFFLSFLRPNPIVR